MARWAKFTCIMAMLATLAGFAFRNGHARAQEPQTKPATPPESVHLIPSLDGADLFRAYCAPCHGKDGTGNGPVAPALNSKLPDLTTLANRNNGLFPVERVKKLIAGDEVVIAHGSREMPIWGPIFHQIERDRDYGHVRLTNVTKYVKSIQQK